MRIDTVCLKIKVSVQGTFMLIKLHCDERFTHALTAYGCVFKEITLVGSNQGTFFEIASACSKRT